MFCNTEFFISLEKFAEQSFILLLLLQKDVNCNKSKEHFLTAIRTLELMQVGFKT